MKKILETNAKLKEQLETARQTAVKLRDELAVTDPMDVVYIGLALEAVELRQRYYEKQVAAPDDSEAA